jgi:hypothetical protein
MESVLRVIEGHGSGFSFLPPASRVRRLSF